MFIALFELIIRVLVEGINLNLLGRFSVPRDRLLLLFAAVACRLRFDCATSLGSMC